VIGTKAASKTQPHSMKGVNMKKDKMEKAKEAVKKGREAKGKMEEKGEGKKLFGGSPAAMKDKADKMKDEKMHGKKMPEKKKKGK
jgi:hypothetical protein